MSKGGDISTGTEAWNVADRFTKEKVEKLLEELDYLQRVAKHGVYHLDEKYNFTPNQLRARRCDALEMFLSVLEQLMGNTKFYIKAGDKGIYELYFIKLNIYDQEILNTYSTKESDSLNEEIFDINEKLFNNLYIKLTEIKDGLLTPLNNAGLIFKKSDEFDFGSIKQKIIDGG